MGPYALRKKRLKLLLNLFVLILSLYGISKKDFTYQEGTPFDQFLINSFSPVQRGLFFIREQVSFTIRHYFFLVNASIENDSLKKRVQELENTIFQLMELKRENQRLKQLLKFGEEISHEKVLAQVAGWDSSNNFKMLRINKGLKDGIKLKSTVVTAGGLVGHVYRSTDHFSDILTILDQNNHVDTIIGRTRSHGIVEGFSPSKCIMKYVHRNEPVMEGDFVLTAGLGNIYPKGLKVGTISKIERERYGITQFIEVTPSVDFSKLEEVVVLVAQDDMELQKELQTLEHDGRSE